MVAFGALTVVLGPWLAVLLAVSLSEGSKFNYKELVWDTIGTPILALAVSATIIK